MPTIAAHVCRILSCPGKVRDLAQAAAAEAAQAAAIHAATRGTAGRAGGGGAAGDRGAGVGHSKGAKQRKPKGATGGRRHGHDEQTAKHMHILKKLLNSPANTDGKVGDRGSAFCFLLLWIVVVGLFIVHRARTTNALPRCRQCYVPRRSF